MKNRNPRKRFLAALIKPIQTGDFATKGDFDPWGDIMMGIHGGYSSESDDLMIDAMISIRDGKTFQYMVRRGFAGEFAIYVLSGFGYIEYGSSPRYGWPDSSVADIWTEMINKWMAYYKASWGDEYEIPLD